MKKIVFRRSALTTVAIAAIFGANTAWAELDSVQLEVINGNHGDPWTINILQPFFEKTLPEASGGKITAHSVPYTELGMSGFEMMDLLRLGTNDITWGVPGYLSGEAPIAEGLELPGITGDYNLMFQAQDAYREIFDEALRENFNAKLIFFSQQPALQAYCRLSPQEIENFSLDTMKGKKSRIHSTSFADFVEAYGGVPVTIPFVDVIPGLERGVIDCALTAPTAAYAAKIGQVANTVVEIRSGYTTHFFAMNLDTWNGLNAETQEFLTEQFAKVEQEARDYTPHMQEIAAQCLGEGPCELGEPAGMAYVKMTPEDEQALRQRVEETVLPRWASRCGPTCADEWNSALSGILGMTIKSQ
ncbi:TRAP transporter substrate-binding protein DctP [Paracoccus pantotrophus]|uniref:TRAP transporter substrate-binding protein DctP n=1 Tax=Paracoccus pantotrophus TaxID=82367 RepID=A0A7H9BNV6_PARPN|nr:TRAP transporter substrate-binding protein DctP [Paracoccus pantotrophus]QLH12997.1 TRAP transporter substrate-binding protein DctP [Paracoccus pantotrophus]